MDSVLNEMIKQGRYYLMPSFTHKEIKHEYQLENYLKNIRNPAHGISITKLRLGVHSLRIQTGKYESTGASIPVEDRKCLVCKSNYLRSQA